MTLPTYYTNGSVSVANGATTVTGTGTGWGGDTIMAGDLFCDPAQPMVPPQRIASVATNGLSLELAVGWPGTTMAAIPYEIRFVGIVERSTAQTRRMLEGLTYGLLFEWVISLSHEDGVISEQVGVITVPVPRDITVQGLTAYLNEPSDSGNVVIDLNLNGVSVMSTELTVNQGENSSEAAGTTPYVLVEDEWDTGQVLTIDFDTAGNNAAGAKLTIVGQRRN